MLTVGLTEAERPPAYVSGGRQTGTLQSTHTQAHTYTCMLTL